MDTSAIMGFMNALMDVIKREKPDHLAVCFDKGGSDYRYEMYKEYKANRAQFDTIRLALIKVAARVTEMATRIKIALPSS